MDRSENLRTLEELEDIVENLKNKGKKIVFTNGCFDVLHKGHVKILKQMKELGDVLIIALNSDKSVREFKGEDRPINNEIDRAFVVGELKGVDYVVIFEGDNPMNILKTLKPDVVAKGGAGLDDRINTERKFVESYGGVFRLLPFIEGYSSTHVIDRIKSG